MKVRVYRNITTGLISIKSKSTGRVIAHADTVELLDATFLVNESGRQRVLSEKRKNVHAYIEGTLVAATNLVPYKARMALHPDSHHHFEARLETWLQGVQVTYNPYKFATFVDKSWHCPIHRAEKVRVSGTGQMVAWVHRHGSRFARDLKQVVTPARRVEIERAAV